MAERIWPFAAVFAVAFQLLFYTALLFNSGAKEEDRIPRWAVLERAIGVSEPENPNLFADAARRLSEPANLLQRVPLFSAAATLVILATLLGELLCLAASAHRSETHWLDRVLAAFAVGMAAVSTATQCLGLFGILSRTLVFMGGGVVLVAYLAVFAWKRLHGNARHLASPSAENHAEPEGGVSNGIRLLLVLGMIPFLLILFLAASLPTTDYDALGYHLLGPKEYWLAGRITFLPHNVYTSFPFFTEMFSLLGMVLLGDWFEGGIAGQVVLATFGPATALSAGRLGARFFGERAGWLTAFLYLTTPWIYRLSTIPYVEGTMLFYTVMAIDAAWFPTREEKGWLAGFYSGVSMACKYPGLVMSALPAVAILMFRTTIGWRKSLSFFLLGFAVTAGPWLVRNAWWTGNPVYPLLQKQLGGSDWSMDQRERFDRAHRSSDYSLSQFASKAVEIAIHSDWQSALVFAFAPLSLVFLRKRETWCLVGLVGYQYLVYWFLTHRLDRFWLPLEPFVVILAAGVMAAGTGRIFRTTVMLSLLVGWVYNLAYCTSGLCGLANYTADIHRQQAVNIASFWPAVAVANEPKLVPRNSTVLFVGFAAVHESEPRSLYNTTFDNNLLEQMARLPSGAKGIRDPREVRRQLRDRGIDYLLVDWSWIQRYRSPGNYGFTPFVQPEVFAKLRSAGVLKKIPFYPPGFAHEPIELFQVVGEDAVK